MFAFLHALPSARNALLLSSFLPDTHMQLSDLLQLSQPRGQVQASMMNFHGTKNLALRNLSYKFAYELFGLWY